MFCKVSSDSLVRLIMLKKESLTILATLIDKGSRMKNLKELRNR